ncbi:MAG TPA: 50S ribosomal protein L23 [Candidatus Binataceae bacterium]|nr:50S ribosomal protein L23 [Candidatus Binataceae bacterium]HVB80083.1 50S ribosomal protein L23 [Candidatus Binataceae bacterium]
MIDESLILAPLVTEKGTLIAEESNQVAFRVRPEATKDTIRETVEELFKVTVIKVRTSNFMGKQRRRGRTVGRQTNWKKAYVTLKEGDRIEFFEGA